MRRMSWFVVVGLVAFTAMPLRPLAQGAPPLAGAQITHVGVVVPNVEKALQEYARVMGFAVPKDLVNYGAPLPGSDKKAQIRLATLRMSNFHIEVNQPMNGDGPYAAFLKAHGPGIDHVGLRVPETVNIDDLRAALEQRGGRWVLGSKGGTFAFIEFPAIGVTFEIIKTGATLGQPPVEAKAGALPPLAALPVRHVGMAAADTAAVIRTFGTLFDGTAPKVNEYKDSQYPPQSGWNASAFLRLASWPLQPLYFEVIESAGGPTPWSDFLQKHKGNTVQHVSVAVGDQMDEQIADLQKKGGAWTNGKPGGAYAYLDFADTLGLIFELNGSSKSAAK